MSKTWTSVTLAPKIEAPLFTKPTIAAQEGEKSTGNRMFWIVLIGSIRKVDSITSLQVSLSALGYGVIRTDM
jgi:hypothetical protein